LKTTTIMFYLIRVDANILSHFKISISWMIPYYFWIYKNQLSCKRSIRKWNIV